MKENMRKLTRSYEAVPVGEKYPVWIGGRKGTGGKRGGRAIERVEQRPANTE
jgi:hypothetical protein